MLELLAPAGSPEAVTAAVQCGANAVYLGYGDFNARRNAKNFSPEEFAALPDTPVGRFARAATAGPMQKNMARGAGGLCLHDVCPVLYLTHPELFTGRQAGVHVETRGTVTYAKTVTDLDSDAKFPERNVFVVLGVDRAGFAAHITEALSSYAG